MSVGRPIHNYFVYKFHVKKNSLSFWKKLVTYQLNFFFQIEQRQKKFSIEVLVQVVYQQKIVEYESETCNSES